MKKISLVLLIVFMTVLVGQAQSTKLFKSKNYYGNGITEYLELVAMEEPPKSNMSDKFYYYTSNNPSKIELKVVNVEATFVGEMVSLADTYAIYTVTFPNDSKEYKLSVQIGSGLRCINPDDSVQEYCVDGFNCED